jgi:pimeloyl-ACP methyl ester carboxylesterase
MRTPSPDFVSTGLGRLHIRQGGNGPTAILWHSLFVDSRSWGPVFDQLARQRRVIAVDGPCHGGSERLHRDFTFDEVVDAANEALDRLGVSEPVDWVGNAWGGHVGILLAARYPDRVRTLITIGTPVQWLSTRERRTVAGPLVHLYRLAGPRKLLLKALSEALLGTEAVAAQPDRGSVIMNSFASTDRDAMFHAMRSMMLKRPTLSAELPRITAPTLMLAARDDAMGWQLPDAQTAVAAMQNGRAGTVAGTGHVSPLLFEPDSVARAVVDFWKFARADTKAPDTPRN